MMTSLAQSHSPYPGGIQQHPGVPQGHPMAGVPHNPGQQMQGQPGMNPQMHMGVSGPGGPQVSQAGALMGGMPPGAGGPSAHALQHLNPQAQQAQMYQQQMFANNPQLQQMQQQQMIQQHRQQQAARQALMAQQYSGAMPGVGMPNGMNQMTQAQYNAMRQGGPMARPVNLPQHLQQAQQQAQHSLEQQQAQQQHQHQQHLLQQMALQQQAQQTGNNQQGQQQMNPQQIQNMQAQMAAQQQHAQAQAQAQAAAAAAQQQSQAQVQAQSQTQQSQPNPQTQPQQPQPQAQQQQPNMQQQQQAAAMAAMSQQQQQQRQGEKLKGQCLMRLMQFGDHLSAFSATKQREDLNYWLQFVDRFFSSKGVLRHSVLVIDNDESNKQYEIPFHALPRYFHTHFESGIKNIQMIMERGSEKELPNNGHFVESVKSSFVYWFESGTQLIANGTLRAHFDGEQKIELFEFVTTSHEEYLPITKVVEAARPLHEWNKEWKTLNLIDGKQSPEINKKKQKAMKSPQQAPPEIDLPASKVKKSMGITPSVFRFLELAEVLGQMNPLFNYSHQNINLAPYTALDQYVATQTMNANNLNGQQPSGPRTPGMSNFPLGASPAAAHLQLPDGSPHVTGSPAQGQAMQLQQSQHGTSSSGPSANTSPNASNKRRRPSAVKENDENLANGNQTKSAVKPSPRIGGKRQKGNPA